MERKNRQNLKGTARTLDEVERDALQLEKGLNVKRWLCYY